MWDTFASKFQVKSLSVVLQRAPARWSGHSALIGFCSRLCRQLAAGKDVGECPGNDEILLDIGDVFPGNLFVPVRDG